MKEAGGQDDGRQAADDARERARERESATRTPVENAKTREVVFVEMLEEEGIAVKSEDRDVIAAREEAG